MTVSDNGPGVPESERGRVFDRFYRLEQNRSTPGSGLGLALVAADRATARRARQSAATPGQVCEARVTFPRRADPGSKHWDLPMSRYHPVAQARR